MREIKFRGKCIDNSNLVYGDYLRGESSGNPCVYISDYIDGDYKVEKETLGQYTGLKDKNGTEIYEGDIIKLFDLDYKLEVVFECGAFQLATKKTINWDKLSNKIEEYTGCNNNPNFCMNDNVVSLWEIYWNFNEEEDCVNCCEVIGNIHESEVNEDVY